jgi:dTDP-4-dehydrorhamnose reductase
MRILILGGDGMLGHQLFRYLRKAHNVRATIRRDLSNYDDLKLFATDNTYDGVDARDFERVLEVAKDFRPEAIINAVGIVKQRSDAKECLPSLEINALLPHRLAVLCRTINARLIHMSTDCVFSGRKGGYTEDDAFDAEDLYGQTKFLGEVHAAHAVTLRSSIIGLELNRKTGLVEWFLNQRTGIKGYRRAIFSGLTTTEMARVIERVLVSHCSLSGLWHVASSPISKYELLCKLAAMLGRADVSIEPDDEFVCDRSLDGRRFERATGYHAPSWDQMLNDLAEQVRKREMQS